MSKLVLFPEFYLIPRTVGNIGVKKGDTLTAMSITLPSHCLSVKTLYSSDHFYCITEKRKTEKKKKNIKIVSSPSSKAKFLSCFFSLLAILG